MFIFLKAPQNYVTVEKILVLLIMMKKYFQEQRMVDELLTFTLIS